MNNPPILIVDKHNLDDVSLCLSDSFVKQNIYERKHIQEWIRKNSEILGEDLLIISTEFDRFKEVNDRLDILALDKAGNLVVIELKRDDTAGYAELQALRYAAMISSMTIEDVSEYFKKYQSKNGDDISTEVALKTIQNFIDGEEIELSSRPRIILCSEDFSTQLTTTVLWLREKDIDITCVKMVPYNIDNKFVISSQIIIPLPEIKQYQTELLRKEEKAKIAIGSRTKKAPSLKILIDEGFLKIGDILFLDSNIPTAFREAHKLTEKSFFKATITEPFGKTYYVIWSMDNEKYTIQALSNLIMKKLDPNATFNAAGTYFWSNGDKKCIATWADEVWANKNLQ